MNITGSTRVFMIVGDPVAQVRAPEVYNPLFRRHGVDAVLVPMKVAPAQLAGFVRHAFAAQNLGGMWVTIPHKSAMQGLKPDDPLPFDPAGVDAGAAVVDIIMKNTPLQQACAARGVSVHGGYEMLVQQIPEYLKFLGLPQLAQIMQEDLSEVRALLGPR
jgi:shikimate 5-dehydrogenase